MNYCLNCHAETTNGLILCELCQRFATECLETIPTYFANLARWQPGHAGSRPVPGSRTLYDGTTQTDGTGDRISDTLDTTTQTLTTQAHKLAAARPHLTRLLNRLTASRSAETITEAEAVAWLCKAFERHLPSIATLDWCGEFTTTLAEHEKQLRALMPLVPGWYAGGCRQVVRFDDEGAAVRCGTPTYVTPGLTWVTCHTCGATTYARDHLDVVLDEARTAVMRPKAAAATIVALVDTEQSERRLYTRIRQWAFNGDLTAIRNTTRDYVWDDTTKRMVVATVDVGRARYRLGDILDLVRRDTRSLNGGFTSRAQ